MKTLTTGLASLLATTALVAFPTAATAEYLVPPGNSAVNQYTETYPTAGGQKQAGNGHHGESRKPAQVLGTHNTRRLDQQGADGRAAAEIAAATAPSPSVAASGEEAQEAERHTTAGGGSGSSSGGDGGGKAAGQHEAGGGSSGLGSVISQATGSSSSGELGLRLPLAILAVTAWSVAHLLRQRRKPTV
jgi:hypothetical protein